MYTHADITVLLPVASVEEPFQKAINSLDVDENTGMKILVLDHSHNIENEDVNLVFCECEVLRPKYAVSNLAELLNYGIDHISTSLFARMDADDVSYPKRFKNQLMLLNQNSGYDVIASAVAPLDFLYVTVNELKQLRMMSHPSWMGKTKWLKRHKYDGKFEKAQDVELLLRTYRTSKFMLMGEPQIKYNKLKMDTCNRLKKLKYLSKALRRNRSHIRLVEFLIHYSLTLLKILTLQVRKCVAF